MLQATLGLFTYSDTGLSLVNTQTQASETKMAMNVVHLLEVCCLLSIFRTTTTRLNDDGDEEGASKIHRGEKEGRERVEKKKIEARQES